MTHDVMLTSLFRQKDAATSFWRNNDVNITSCVRWDAKVFLFGMQPLPLGNVLSHIVVMLESVWIWEL